MTTVPLFVQILKPPHVANRNWGIKCYFNINMVSLIDNIFRLNLPLHRRYVQFRPGPFVNTHIAKETIYHDNRLIRSNIISYTLTHFTQMCFTKGHCCRSTYFMSQVTGERYKPFAYIKEILLETNCRTKVNYSASFNEQKCYFQDMLTIIILFPQ